jgi:CRISPR-associated protein Cas1
MKSKVEKIVLDGYGSYLGMEKGCYIIKDKNGNTEKYPQFENEIGEVMLKSGNIVTVGALVSLAFWEIDVVMLTQKGKPIAVLKSLDYDSHVKTRLCQYEAVNNGKGMEIAKQIIHSKIESQNRILRKHGLRQLDLMIIKQKIDTIPENNLKTVRKQLLPIEGRCSEQYFKQIFQLLPKQIRIENRKTFKAYDGVNNIFNLAYEILQWKVYRAIIKAKLEPYLGFLHSEQFGKPSLVCDLMELYRYLIDDFLLEYSKKLTPKDFIMKIENFSPDKKGKRQYLNGCFTRDLMQKLNSYFERKIDIARIKHGNRQTIETLINEEVLLFAKYLRNERENWIPRIGIPD